MDQWIFLHSMQSITLRRLLLTTAQRKCEKNTQIALQIVPLQHQSTQRAENVGEKLLLSARDVTRLVYPIHSVKQRVPELSYEGVRATVED
eukprot:XP_001709327.1 Hypothetical protein GL50803_89849 [Giardia lamblia ATCC 50803]